MGAFEIAHAIGWNKPIYARQQLDYEAMGWEDIDSFTVLKNYIKVVPVSKIAEDYLNIGER